MHGNTDTPFVVFGFWYTRSQTQSPIHVKEEEKIQRLLIYQVFEDIVNQGFSLLKQIVLNLIWNMQ